MRVLLTVHQFLPDCSSGTEILTLSSAKELQRRGHEVTILTAHPTTELLNDEQRFDRYEYEGLEVHRFRHDYVPMGGQENIVEAEYNNPLSAAYFRQLIDYVRPDMVHFFHLSRLSGSLVDVCQERNLAMVLTATDFWFICPTSQLRLPDNSMCNGPQWHGANCVKHITIQTQRGKLARLVGRMPEPLLAAGILALRTGIFNGSQRAKYVGALAKRKPYLINRLNKVDRILAPTRLMSRLLEMNGVDVRRIEFCRYGIDLGAGAENARASRATKQDLRVGFIGTIYEHKGVHVLLEAMSRIPRAAIEVTIYGKLGEFPKYTERLKSMSQSDARIRFMGTFPNADIAAVFSRLDVLVVPSIWYENTPLVIYTANAFQCPVIASDLGGMSEAVDNERNGFLFPPSDSAALARILQRLAEDRNLVRDLSIASRPPKSSKEYVDDLERIYASVVKRRPRLSRGGNFAMQSGSGNGST